MQDKDYFRKFNKSTSLPKMTIDSFKFPCSWRRKSTPQESTSLPSTIVDRCCVQMSTSSSNEQAISSHAAYVKMRWRSQQIANQQRGLKAQSSFWSGWVFRRGSAPDVLYHRRR